MPVAGSSRRRAAPLPVTAYPVDVTPDLSEQAVLHVVNSAMASRAGRVLPKPGGSAMIKPRKRDSSVSKATAFACSWWSKNGTTCDRSLGLGDLCSTFGVWMLACTQHLASMARMTPSPGRGGIGYIGKYRGTVVEGLGVLVLVQERDNSIVHLRKTYLGHKNQLRHCFQLIVAAAVTSLESLQLPLCEFSSGHRFSGQESKVDRSILFCRTGRPSWLALIFLSS